MDRKIYAVTVATGHLGSRVARGLLAAGQEVRVLGRDAARLQELVALGASPFVGDIADPQFVERAFAGADAAFLLVKVDADVADFGASFRRVGQSYARAAAATGLRNALFVSSMGAHDPEIAGVMGIHREVEAILDQVPGLHAYHLRAASFFDNLFYFLPAMRAAGALATPIAPSAPVDWAGPDDLGALATATLLDIPFRETRRVEARGSTPVPMAEIAAMIAGLLRSPFPPVHVGREANLAALKQAGLGDDFSARMQLTWEIFSRRLVRDPAATLESTAILPATFAPFLVATFVPALTAPPRRHGFVLEYRLRDDVDLAGYLREVASFVSAMRRHRSDTAYTSYQTEEDPRRFVHVGDFATEAISSLRGEPFFCAFTRALRERCVESPRARTLHHAS